MLKNELGVLEDGMRDLPEGWIVLLETSPEKVLDVSLAAMKILTDNNYSSIVLSASRPCSNLFSLYEKNKIDKGKIFILDCVCKTLDSSAADNANIKHLENASVLTEMAIELGKRMDSAKGKMFIFIDSITTLLIHNKSDVLARFVHSILTKMRMKNVSCLLVSMEGETNREVRAEIAQLCDKVINV